MKFVKYFLLLVFLLSSISASCTSNQIDINTASLSKLDELTGIGPAKAQAIVATRPYNSLEDLDKVYGIGPATLEKIKAQGLACVENEVKTTPTKEISSTSSEKTLETKKFTEESSKITAETVQNLPSESIINLNADQVKGETIYESKNEKVKKNLLVAFCVFLIGLIFLLTRK